MALPYRCSGGKFKLIHQVSKPAPRVLLAIPPHRDGDFGVLSQISINSVADKVSW